MGGSFFSSLIGSYSGTMINKHREERDREEKGQEAEIRVLQAAAATGQLGPEELQATFQRMEEITQEMSGKGGKKKGGFSFGNLIGKFSDTGGKNQAGAKGGASGGPPTTDGTGAADSSAPPSRPMSEQTPIGGTSAQPPVNLGAPPSRPGANGKAGGVSLGQPPSRFNFRKNTDVITEEETARTKARIATMDEADKKKIAEAATEYKKTHPEATDREVYDKVIGPLTGIKVEDANEREETKQKFQTTREENRQKFQLSMETMKEKAAERRQNQHDEMMMKALGARMSFQDRERLKITPAQINSEINGSLTSMRQQMNEADKRLTAAEKAAQDKSGSLFKMFKDDPDVAGAKQDVNNMRAAIAHIERNRNSVVTGKKDLDDVIDEAQAIMIGGSSTLPPSMEPGEVIDLRQPEKASSGKR